MTSVAAAISLALAARRATNRCFRGGRQYRFHIIEMQFLITAHTRAFDKAVTACEGHWGKPSNNSVRAEDASRVTGFLLA